MEKRFDKTSNKTSQTILISLFCLFFILFFSILIFYPQIDQWLDRFTIKSNDFSIVQLGFDQKIVGEIVQERNVSLARFLGIPYAEPPKVNKPLIIQISSSFFIIILFDSVFVKLIRILAGPEVVAP